jgi:hypothetical protein
MNENCVMCGRPIGKKGVTYELTEKERQLLKVLLQEGTNPSYCRACDAIMHDPEQAAQFFKGYWLTKFRAAGVPQVVAEQRAKKAYDFFLQKALKHRASS